MKKRFALLASCLAVAAGCWSGDEEKGAGAKATEQPAASAAAPAASMVTVSMKDVKFVSADVKVKVGGTIKWTNDDPFPHTVTKQAGPGPQFDSGTVNDGGEFEQRFTKPGKIDYFCRLHSGQTGTITVE